jgi:drug/metabolite transporter (DMT)-like permease
MFVATGPLWVAIVSAVLLNERLRGAAVVGLLVASLGGVIIGLSDACS